MLADLHMHTTFSDGVNTPEELVREAEKAHLCAMAITDHDNTLAYDEAKKVIDGCHRCAPGWHPSDPGC